MWMKKRYGAQMYSQWEELGEQCKERLRSDGRDEKQMTRQAQAHIQKSRY